MQIQINYLGYELAIDVAEEDGRACFGIEAMKLDGALNVHELATFLTDHAFEIEREARKQLAREVREAREEAA